MKTIKNAIGYVACSLVSVFIGMLLGVLLIDYDVETMYGKSPLEMWLHVKPRIYKWGSDKTKY